MICMYEGASPLQRKRRWAVGTTNKRKRQRKPKILFLDIETLPNEVASWSIGRKVSLGYENIRRERHIVCAAWKWGGSKKVWSVHANSAYGQKSDLSVLKALYKVLSKADGVCGHNINRFDIPYIRTRGLYHGLKPFPPIKQIDTYLIARRKFYLNSNRLDYLGQLLKVGKKIKTDYGLWLKCMEGDKKAVARMVRYNKQDVRLVEKVYGKIVPYDACPINRLLLSDDTRQTSPCCDAGVQYRGVYQTKSANYRRFSCNDCGSWHRESKPIRRTSRVSI